MIWHLVRSAGRWKKGKAMKSTGMQRKWRIALGVSLALNLLVLGAVAGSVWRHNAHDARGPKSGTNSSFAIPYLRALPKPARQQMREIAMRGGSDQKGYHANRVKMQREVTAAIRAEPFDAQALKRVVSDQRDRALERDAQFQQAWLSVIEGMDTAARQAYADKLDAMMARRKGRKKQN